MIEALDPKPILFMIISVSLLDRSQLHCPCISQHCFIRFESSSSTFQILHFYGVYSTTLNVTFMMIFFEGIVGLLCLPDDNNGLIILGDFNISEYIACRKEGFNDGRVVNSLENFLKFLGLVQFKEVVNASNRILDLIWSRISLIVRGTLLSFVFIDAHDIPLEFLLPSALLNADWAFLDGCSDVDLTCEEFHDVLDDIFAQ